MQTFNHQKGMATILLVLLIGISVMLLTASLAKTLVSNKEASVAAHAQINAKLLGWSGVSTFRDYIFKKGSIGLQELKKLELDGEPLILLDENGKTVSAKNIKVTGCTDDGPCSITADISSDNQTSHAAITINTVYDLKIKENKSPVISFSGDTFLSGTTLAAENPNTEAVINVEGGHLSLQAGFKTNDNISKLTINVKKVGNKGGDVIIDCSLTTCGNLKEININAEGYVHIIHPGNFGNIKSLEWVKLQTGVTAKNIEALGTVHLGLKSKAENIRTLGDVALTEGSSAKNIYTNGDVVLLTDVTASSIQTIGSVSVSVFSEVTGNVLSGKEVNISNSTIGGDVKAYEYVDLDTNAKVKGSVYAQNQSNKGIGTYHSAVRLSTSWIGGNVYANGHLRLLDSVLGEDIQGSVYLTGEVKSVSTRTIKGQIIENLRLGDIPELNFTIPPALDKATFEKELQDYIAAQMDFHTEIDVTAYKQDANYIFTRSNGVARVYLNHLRNEATQIRYEYKVNDVTKEWEQYAYNKDDEEVLLSEQVKDRGFYLGKYTRNGHHYVGAICAEIVQEQALTNSSLIETGHRSGYCASDIIGYLPRVSLDFNGFNGDNRLIFGWPDDYDFTLPDTFYIRSTQESSVDNAAFAPGIMYFEGKLIISGDENINADSMTTAFTNTFLAEGSIDAIAMSPRIFSPYNVIREGSQSLICSRNLSSVNGKQFSTSPPATSPQTLSNKFLTPVNLCKDANTISFQPQNGGNKLDLSLVALMSNKVVRIGACAQIYGDVLAGSTVEGSASCGITSNPNGIYGNISTAGKPPTDLDVQQHNTFGAGSKIIIPKDEYTNVKAAGFYIDSVALQWAKYN